MAKILSEEIFTASRFTVGSLHGPREAMKCETWSTMTPMKTQYAYLDMCFVEN